MKGVRPIVAADLFTVLDGSSSDWRELSSPPSILTHIVTLSLGPLTFPPRPAKQQAPFTLLWCQIHQLLCLCIFIAGTLYALVAVECKYPTMKCCLKIKPPWCLFDLRIRTRLNFDFEIVRDEKKNYICLINLNLYINIYIYFLK